MRWAIGVSGVQSQKDEKIAAAAIG